MGGIGTWRVDIARRVLRLSEPTGAMFGLQRMQLPIEAFLARIHDEDRARVTQLYEDAAQGRADYNTVYRMHLPDGRLRCWLRAARWCTPARACA
ncbi:hypothetical protein NB688_003977 [Xanthomonas sacchari]|uniref:PAS fold-3 domain-containing protein n=5 Tax=Xanthomonas TaxID=338 RepID=A0ABT3DZT2_9XANT|nr:PAS domain-containing protein [Xanthomonas sacchari]MCW0401019.1 hypothetical protein [Xanthomonas sacchari]MCW0421811.1 hypothetical protein [Xanthomonas sacchari]UYK72294.1 PAS domain-containing protein [Xanthomonas sacchari]